MLSNNLETDLRSDLFHKFKLPYDHVEEAMLRLNGTIVTYQGRPILVHQVDRHPDDPRDFRLGCQSAGASILDYISYSDPLLDCRAIKSGYITRQGETMWLERLPSRVFQQGINGRNTLMTNVGGSRNIGVGSFTSLLKPLSERFIVPWNETWQRLFQRETIRNLRLSDDIAVSFNNNSEELEVYYRQRFLGTIKDNYTFVDEMDGECPWIRANLAKSDLQVRVKETS